MIEFAIIIGVLLAAFQIYLSIRRIRLIIAAEWRMAKVIHMKYTAKKIEELRDELLGIKVQAIEAGFKEMDRIYAIERELNQLSVSLDKRTRQLISEGLRQSSDEGKVRYMLKLIEMSTRVHVAA